MTLGKITKSNQDIVYVKVRVEDETFMETHNGTSKTNYYLVNSVGEKFTTPRWFGHIKIKIGDSPAGARLRLTLWDTPSKEVLYCETESELTAGGCVIHVITNPLPAGDYYLELTKVTDSSIGIGVVTDSTLHNGYKEGVATSDWDIECKLMYVSDQEEERAVAVVGDEVDSGVTVTSTGSDISFIKVGALEKAVCSAGDSLSNGGQILNGCWFVEEDQ
jgi:hypothetical protein